MKIRETPLPVTRTAMPPFDEYCEEIKDLWETGWLTHDGYKHQALEKSLMEYMQVPNMTLFTNGHLALEAAFDVLGIHEKEIITTPFTFASTTQAIVRTGNTPVFCDILSDNCCIDASKIEKLITNRTAAILPVHVYGNICDYKAIQQIADRYNLKVIYDAAHAFGVTVDGKGAGILGDLSMFSFHATKVFHTIEGGCLAYAKNDLNDLFTAYKKFGQFGKNEAADIIGTNAKLTEIAAAMGICNLRHIDEYIANRKKAALRYRERLAGIKGLKLCLCEQTYVKSNYAYFPVIIEDNFNLTRDRFISKLQEANIYARRYFHPLTSEFPAYKGRFDIQDTPIAKYISERVLTVPLYAGLDLKDVDYICDVICQK
jgi:dTDP-4-amino-4,6-dideoxygalactose transaminase